jgi:hypothetical protein
MVPLYSGTNSRRASARAADSRRAAACCGVLRDAPLAVEVLVIEGHLIQVFLYGQLDSLRRELGGGLGELAVV